MEEVWKPVRGFEGLYEVSNCGRVISHHKYGGIDNRIMKFKTDKDGYLCVKLCNNGNQKHCHVHRLVAEAFIDNPDNYPMINHKDEQKQNNFVGNLEWCNAQYNNTYGHRLEIAMPKTHAKGSCSPRGRMLMSYIGRSRNKRCASYFDGVLVNEYLNITEAGKSVGIKPVKIAMCCSDGLKTEDGLEWKYIT